MTANKPMVAREGRDNQVYNQATGARLVAGCVCVNQGRDKVIMVSSSAHPGKWVLPKGGVESDEVEDEFPGEYSRSAERETWEEAGVTGVITGKLPVVLDSRLNAPVIKGEFDPNKKVPKSEFHFYEMNADKLASEWPESKKRQRRWCTYSEAVSELKRAKRPELVEVIKSSSLIKP